MKNAPPGGGTKPAAPEWPKLSETLTHPRAPNVCQGCGALAEPDPTDDGWVPLQLWRECDETDRGTGTLVALCNACSKALIEKHPRAYLELPPYDPEPGTFPLCLGCRHREGLACALAPWGGIEGVRITGPAPSTVHLNHGGGRCSWLTLYPGWPTACDRREDATTGPQTPN